MTKQEKINALSRQSIYMVAAQEQLAGMSQYTLDELCGEALRICTYYGGGCNTITLYGHKYHIHHIRSAYDEIAGYSYAYYGVDVATWDNAILIAVNTDITTDVTYMLQTMPRKAVGRPTWAVPVAAFGDHLTDYDAPASPLPAPAMERDPEREAPPRQATTTMTQRTMSTLVANIVETTKSIGRPQIATALIAALMYQHGIYHYSVEIQGANCYIHRACTGRYEELTGHTYTAYDIDIGCLSDAIMILIDEDTGDVSYMIRRQIEGEMVGDDFGELGNVSDMVSDMDDMLTIAAAAAD